MRLHRVFVGAVLALLFVTGLQARPRVTLHKPPPGQFNVIDLWWVYINNPDDTTYPGRWLYTEVNEDVQGRVFYASSNRFDVPRGTITKRLRDVTVRNQWARPGYEAFLLRTGTLPEGVYTYFVMLLPDSVSDSGRMEVRLPGTPRLLTPRDGSATPIGERNPQFTWLRPLPPPGNPVNYEMTVVEVLPGQTGNEAILANRPWFSRGGMLTTTLRYPSSARPLEPGRLYAWQVQASAAGRASPPSEVWTFTYRPVPPELDHGLPYSWDVETQRTLRYGLAATEGGSTSGSDLALQFFGSGRAGLGFTPRLPPGNGRFGWFPASKHYSGVRLQQGRVIVDDDWNEAGAYHMKMAGDGKAAIHFGAPGEYPAAAAYGSGGEVILTGASAGAMTGYDFVTVRYDSVGRLLWVRRFDSRTHGNDEPVSTTADDAGNVYVAGRTGTGASGFGCLTVKYGPDGNVVWTAGYQGPSGNDEPVGVALGAANVVFVTGRAAQAGGGSAITTLRYDARTGAPLDTIRYTGLGHARPAGSVSDALGNLYVAGTDRETGKAASYLTLKYDSTGAQSWACLFAVADSDDVAGLALDRSGHVYVTGAYTQGASRQYLTLKYDDAGTLLDTMLYDGGYGDNEPLGIQVDTAGCVYIAGRSRNAAGLYELATVKYDSAGNVLWVRRSNPEPQPETTSVMLEYASTKGIHIGGRGAAASVPGGSKPVLLNLGRNGEVLRMPRFPGSTGALTSPVSARLDTLSCVMDPSGRAWSASGDTSVLLLYYYSFDVLPEHEVTAGDTWVKLHATGAETLRVRFELASVYPESLDIALTAFSRTEGPEPGEWRQYLSGRTVFNLTDRCTERTEYDCTLQPVPGNADRPEPQTVHVRLARIRD